MPNAVDAKIDEITQAHVVECEAANVSRNVDETAQRVKDAIAEFSALDILASGYWEGLYYEAKIVALRNAVLELAAPVMAASPFSRTAKPDMTPATDPAKGLSKLVDDAAHEPVPAAPKKARKPKAAA